MKRWAIFFLLLGLSSLPLRAEEKEAAVLPEIIVSGRGEISSEWLIPRRREQWALTSYRHALWRRPGEVIETVPGMIVTQHAGGGKANQITCVVSISIIGTDFAFYVDDVPVNLPTHAHGQGYADLNWLIPEIIGNRLREGVYYAEKADFGNTGTADIRYYDVLPNSLLLGEAGALGVRSRGRRGLAKVGPDICSMRSRSCTTTGLGDADELPQVQRAFEIQHRGREKGYSLSAQGYYGIWLGNDQIPQRAINEGLIDRYRGIQSHDGRRHRPLQRLCSSTTIATKTRRKGNSVLHSLRTESLFRLYLLHQPGAGR